MSSPTRAVGTPERVFEHGRRLTREQVVDRILALNPSISASYLRDFPESSLWSYLRRLEALHEPRGRRACWRREGETPAIVTRRRRL